MGSRLEKKVDLSEAWEHKEGIRFSGLTLTGSGNTFTDAASVSVPTDMTNLIGEMLGYDPCDIEFQVRTPTTNEGQWVMMSCDTMRDVISLPKRTTMTFRMNEVLEANYKNKGKWYEAYYKGPDMKGRENF